MNLNTFIAFTSAEVRFRVVQPGMEFPKDCFDGLWCTNAAEARDAKYDITPTLAMTPGPGLWWGEKSNDH